MTTVAVLVPPLHGHVNPALGTAAALARDGHRVVVHLPAEFRGAVGTAGAELAELPPAPEPGWARDLDRLARFASLPARLAEAARCVLPHVLDRLAADPPDVLAVDQLCVWGRLAAAVAGRPTVQLCTSYVPGPAWSPWAEPGFADLPDVPGAGAAWAAVDELAAVHGTPRLTQADLLAGAGTRSVVYVPRALHPAAAAYDDRHAFVGPALRPEPAGPADRALDDLDLAPGRPLVHVSMGTLFGDWSELGALCEAAFADGAWDVVLAAPGAAPTRRGAVRVRPSVPQLAVLRRASVAVTHAGMGSVLEALHAGVPLVAVPQVPEQAITARRLAALGAAVHLDRDGVDAASLRSAVEHVATDPGVRRAVARLRHAVLAAGGAPAAARAVLAAAT